MHKTLLTSAAAAAALLAASTALARDTGTTTFRVTLEGEVEVTPGDPDGSGTALIRVNPRREELCYTLRVRMIEPATAAHVHEAPAGSAGPVVVGLQAPSSGMSRGCVAIDRQQALEIINNPEDYYVNVHNQEYPDGALRGQLEM